MKHESFDEREIYTEGVLDGLALAIDHPKNVTDLRDKIASIKATEYWEFTLREMKQEMKHPDETWKDVEDL
ncbi:MAG: hypothetical protein M0Z77_03475 [Thermoplasmatales archaeon]|nr:hypothetical protein [Thermoplasmatales archaeon]